MIDKRALPSAVSYAIAALSFLLPFAVVSCNGVPVLKFTGANLALGGSIPTPLGPAQHIHPNGFAILAVACAVLGFFVSFLGRRVALASMVPAIIGVISLVFMWIELGESLGKHSGVIIRIYPQIGVWIAGVSLAIAAVWNYWIGMRQLPDGGDGTGGGGDNRNAVVASLFLSTTPA